MTMNPDTVTDVFKQWVFNASDKQLDDYIDKTDQNRRNWIVTRMKFLESGDDDYIQYSEDREKYDKERDASYERFCHLEDLARAGLSDDDLTDEE